MSSQYPDRSEVSGFAEPNHSSAEAVELVAYLQSVSSHPTVKQYVADSIEHLGLKEGMTLFDGGCGIAHDLPELLAAVGSSGHVHLFDHNDQLMDQARKHWEQTLGGVTNYQFTVADLRELPLAENSVDASRVVRALMHVEEPLRAIRELVRITRPNGRIAVVDVDWFSLQIEADDQDVVSAIRDQSTLRYKHPRIGSQLRSLFEEAGMSSTDVYYVGYDSRYTELEPALTNLVIQAKLKAIVSRRAITQDSADAFMTDLRSRADSGQFFAKLTLAMVVGRVSEAAVNP